MDNKDTSFSLVITGVAVNLTHLYPWRPELGFAANLLRMFPFFNDIVNLMMLMMNLSSFHLTIPNNYLLYIGLDDNNGLINKATFNLMYSDHCMEWVENIIKVYQIKGVPKFIVSEGTAGWQGTVLSPDLATFVFKAS